MFWPTRRDTKIIGVVSGRPKKLEESSYKHLIPLLLVWTNKREKWINDDDDDLNFVNFNYFYKTKQIV